MTILFAILLVACIAGIILLLAHHNIASAPAPQELQLSHNLHMRRAALMEVCAELLELTREANQEPYQGMLDHETIAQLCLRDLNRLELTLKLETEGELEVLEVQLAERHLTVQRGQHPPLKLPMASDLSTTALAQLMTFEELSFSWKSQGAHIELLSSATLPQHLNAPTLKAWIEQVHERFKQAVTALKQRQQPWTQVALEQRNAHPIWRTTLLYMAATEQPEEAGETWRALLKRDAQHWQALPQELQGLLSFEDEPGELLGRAYPRPPAAMMETLARRGELERMWRQGTLPEALNLLWFELLSDDDPIKHTLISNFNASQREVYLRYTYPQTREDSLQRLTEHLNDPQHPLCTELTITLEALSNWGGTTTNKHLFKLLADQLRKAPELEPTLSSYVLIRLLKEQPNTLRGLMLKQLLEQLDDREFVELQHTLMTRTEPWTVFEHARAHPRWRDYIDSNLNKHSWSMVAAMLRDKTQLHVARLQSISKFIMAPIHHEEQARILREYFLVAQELDLHKQLWGTLLKTMQRSKAHQEALQFVHDRWEPLIMDRALMGGLSLSEGDANAGGLSVVNAEQGSLTVQDHDPS